MTATECAPRDDFPIDRELFSYIVNKKTWKLFILVTVVYLLDILQFSGESIPVFTPDELVDGKTINEKKIKMIHVESLL